MTSRLLFYRVKMMLGFYRSAFVAAFIMAMLASFPACSSSFYVVVGSFSDESTARELAGSLRTVFNEASIKFEHTRQLYHVYVLETDHFREAEKFREELKWKKAIVNGWILSDAGTADVGQDGDGADAPIRLELYSGNTVLLSSTDNSILTIAKDRGVVKENTRAESETPFRFIARNHAGLSLPGKVSLMRNGTQISVFRTGEVVSFSGRQEHFTLVCHVPGFSPEIRSIHLSELGKITGVSQDAKGVWEVKFNISKLMVNKVPLIYHNLFYGDAAVMKPSAKEAVDLLAAVAKGGNGRIIINSHCNPRTTREITMRGSLDQYFEVGDIETKTGSDKQFTRARAETLSDYLVSQGIDRNRISIMGWGSLDMLVKGAEENTDINDRVEVELLME